MQQSGWTEAELLLADAAGRRAPATPLEQRVLKADKKFAKRKRLNNEEKLVVLLAGVIRDNQDAEAQDVFLRLKRHMDRAGSLVMSEAYGSCQVRTVFFSPVHLRTLSCVLTFPKFPPCLEQEQKENELKASACAERLVALSLESLVAEVNAAHRGFVKCSGDKVTRLLDGIEANKKRKRKD